MKVLKNIAIEFMKIKTFKSLLSKKMIWNGQNIENKKIIVVAEEGLGNTIQFSRYLEILSQLNGKIIFKCQEELTSFI